MVGNSALGAGGVMGATLNNCIVYGNVATNLIAPNFGNTVMNHSCTIPMPTNGVGNITNEPAFVDLAGGNLRLQSNSPCINAGRNASAPGGTDLDGNPRIAGGTVDMGAYEFQSPGSTLSYAWLLQYGLPLDGSADTADPDDDRFDTYHEWRAGTDPTSALSLLRLLPPQPVGADLAVSWSSIPGRSYTLDRSVNFSETPAFLPLASGLPGQTNTTSFTDTNAAAGLRYFYRVGVEE